MSNVTKSIAAFERTLMLVNSPYDRYRYANDSNAISEAAKRGEILFFSGERTGCFPVPRQLELQWASTI